MTRQEALKKLSNAALDYSMRAQFSRVAGLVYETAVMAANTADPLYALGYIDCALNVIETVAPKTEAETLMQVLYIAKALTKGESPEHSGLSVLLIEMERLAA